MEIYLPFCFNASLTDDEIILLITENIEHEVIHAVLDEHVSLETSLYFDRIAHIIRSHTIPGIFDILMKAGMRILSRQEIDERIDFALYVLPNKYNIDPKQKFGGRIK